MIEVQGPNGEVFEFPDGTTADVMREALQGYFGAPTAPSQPAPAPTQPAAPAAPLQEIRARFPQYNDLSDQDLADRLYDRYYSHQLSRDDYYSRIGLSASTAPAAVGSTASAEPEWLTRARAADPTIPVGVDPFAMGNSPLAHPGVRFYSPDRPNEIDVWNQATAATHQMVLPDGSYGPLVPRAEDGSLLPLDNDPADRFYRGALIGSENVLKGTGHLLGSPFDLANLVGNVPLSVADFASGGRVPFRFPVNTGDRIADAFLGVADAAGLPIIPDEQQTGAERLQGDMIDFGTQALAGGAGLARMAPALTERVAAQGGARIGDALVRPYVQNAGRQIVADTAGGMGMGAGVNAAQTYFPDQPWMALPLALAGGVGGGVAASGGQLGMDMAGTMARRRVPDSNVLHPETGAPFRQAETEMAARLMQGQATNAPLASSNIATAVARHGAAGYAPDQMPTTGLLSGDIGLVSAEGASRVRNGVPFMERDQAVRSAAADSVSGVQNPNADQSLVATAAGVARDQQLAPLQNDVANAENSVASIQQGRVQEGAGIAPLASATAQNAASTRLDDALVNQTYVPARTAKNEAFRTAAPQNLPVDISQVAQTAQNILQRVRQLPAPLRGEAADVALLDDFARRLNPEHELNAETRESRLGDVEAPEDWNAQSWWDGMTERDRIAMSQQFGGSRGAGHRANVPWDNNPLAPQIENLFGHLSERGLVTPPGASLSGMDSIPQSDWDSLNMPYETVGQVRIELSHAISRARAEGKLTLADNLSELRSSLSQAIDSVAPGASQHYQQEFAPLYRAGPNDPMAQFTQGVDRDPTRTNPQFAPENTAPRFLSAPEKARALARVFQHGGGDSGRGLAAVRDYMLGDFARETLNADGSLNTARATGWLDRNAPVLNQFRGLAGEFQGYVRSAQLGNDLAATAEQSLAEARRRLGVTEDQINQGAIGALLNQDPRDVARGILAGGYGAGRTADEINQIVANDPAARAGWQAAMAEVLVDRVSGTRTTEGGNYQVQFARLAREFQMNEDVLAQVFDPEQMGTLREGHALLSHFANGELRAATGSQTAERLFGGPWGRAVEIMLKHTYGDLKGGGMMRRLRLVAQSLPNDKPAVDQIIQLAWFNPDVAAYLLEKPVRNLGGFSGNVPLRRLLAGAAANREMYPVEEES